MNQAGIIRKIDPLGRITIPKEVRTVQNWEEGTLIEIIPTADGIEVRAYEAPGERQSVVDDLQGVLKNVLDPNVKQILVNTVGFIQKQTK